MNDDEVNVELGGKQNYEKVEQVDGKKYEDVEEEDSDIEDLIKRPSPE